MMSAADRGFPLALSLGLILATLPIAIGAADRVEQLANDLGSSDLKVRRDAAYKLDEMGAEARAAVPALIRALSDRDPQVWASATHALGNLGEHAAEAVPALIEKLGERTRQVWYRSAHALGRIGAPAVPALREALKSSRASTRSGAVKALGWAQEAAKDAIPEVVALLGDDAEEVRDEAIEALASIGGPALASVVQAISAESARVRLGALRALRLFEGDKTAARGAVTRALEDSAPEVRAEAVLALRKTGLDASRVVDILLDRAGEEDPALASAVVETLLRLPPRDVVTALSEALESRNERVVGVAASVLGKLGPAAARVANDLLAALRRGPAAPVGASLLDTLGRLGAPAAGPIARALEDESWSQPPLEGLSKALGALGPAALGEVGLLLGSKLARARAAAAHAAAAIVAGDPGDSAAHVMPRLAGLLADGDPSVRVAAALALAAVGTKAAGAVEALTRLLGDPAPEARAAALVALTAVGVEAGTILPPLASALRDDDSNVRRRALEAAALLGPRASSLAFVVAQSLGERDAGERALAARTLGKLGRLDADAALPVERALVKALQSAEEGVRQASIEALGLTGPLSGLGAEALARRAQESNVEERLLALSALESAVSDGSLATGGGAVEEAARRACADGEARVRAAGARTLARVLGPPGAAARGAGVKLLTELLGDGDPAVKEEAAAALGALAPEAQEAVPALFALMEDMARRRVAYEALKSIRPRSVPVLVGALRGSDRFLRSFAAECLGELGADAYEAMEELKIALGGEESPRARQAISQAILKIEATAREF